MSTIKKKRPLSPHLTIYKPQISSSLSIFHRITGMVLFISAMVFSWLLISEILGSDYLSYLIVRTQNCWIIKSFLFMISMAIIYHLLNGIRHLFWDIGKGYEIKTMNMTGIIVLLSTLFLNILFWIIIFI